MWQVPTQVALTTALAQGGVLVSGPLPPSNPQPFDQPTNRVAVVVPPGGNISVTLPAIAAGRTGSVTALGLDSSDVTNTRVTTRINGIAVPPEIAAIGAMGSANNPVTLGTPIRLAAGDVFSLFIEDTGGAGLTVQPRIIGFN